MDRKNDDDDNAEGVLAMSEEQIAQHPLVMRMMQRLEALEGRESAGVVGTEHARNMKVRSIQNPSMHENCEGERHCIETTNDFREPIFWKACFARIQKCVPTYLGMHECL